MADRKTAERVLVLGGGPAGVAYARELGDSGIEVMLFDRNDYNQFQPLLYQVASSQLPAEDIARPHRGLPPDHLRGPIEGVSTSSFQDVIRLRNVVELGLMCSLDAYPGKTPPGTFECRAAFFCIIWPAGWECLRRRNRRRAWPRGRSRWPAEIRRRSSEASTVPA
ncbi:FAD-dependent oxidoreductase [Arthrobacter sp. I2-34]|uniref:FAD-dependent oxidoreductase n=1 Tax=Arthrobacter hankyongi TaxID=2904801 RepID=A0ABS9LCY0_9MICC|nr:FAD-dependent oxidoreductase [Arthrobacter hankyongi]MCG2624544.1 FAD-dependent oxidoreductase [Arthrobacter hankyongi]